MWSVCNGPVFQSPRNRVKCSEGWDYGNKNEGDMHVSIP